MLIMGMVRVVLVLIQPTYPPQKVISEDTVIIGGFRNFSASAHDPPRRNNSVSSIQSLIWVVLPLVLVMVMVKVVMCPRPTHLIS